MSPVARTAVAASFLGVGIVASEQVRALAAWTRVGAASVALDMAGYEIALLGLVLAVAWVMPGRLSDTLGLGRGRLPAHAVAALTLGALGLSHAVDGVMTLTRSLEGSVVVSVSRAMEAARGGALVVVLLGSVLAPALCEELLCRGLVQRSVARAVGPFAAVCASATLFGVIHMEWVHGLIAATIGLYFGLAAQWADSTRPAIVAHGANNLAALLGSQGLLVIRAPLAASIALGLALAVGGLLWAARAARRPAAGSALPRGATPDASLQRPAEPTDT